MICEREREKEDKHCHDLLLPHVITSDGHWKCRLTGDPDEPLPNVYQPEADARREHFQILPSAPRCGFSPTKHCGFDSVLPSVLRSCYQIPLISHKRTAHTRRGSLVNFSPVRSRNKRSRTHTRTHATHATHAPMAFWILERWNKGKSIQSHFVIKRTWGWIRQTTVWRNWKYWF